MENQDNELLETGLVDLGGDEPKFGVYELGYHLVPTISEEDLAKSVEVLMSVLKKENAVMVGERFPSKMTLAYAIARRSQGKRENFDSAYFGWVAFEVGREAVGRIKAELDVNSDVLRYLIVQTDREAVNAALTGAVAPLSRESIGKPKRAEETGGVMSDVDLDVALETIEKEDTKTE